MLLVTTEDWFSWGKKHSTGPFLLFYVQIPVGLLDCMGVHRSQMWTARWLRGRLIMFKASAFSWGEVSTQCVTKDHKRTWILLDTISMLWVNLLCKKWRSSSSSHSPLVSSFQSHLACIHQCKPDLQPKSILLLRSAILSMLPQILLDSSYLALPKTFPSRTFFLFLNFYSGIFLGGSAVRSFSSVL